MHPIALFQELLEEHTPEPCCEFEHIVGDY